MTVDQQNGHSADLPVHESDERNVTLQCGHDHLCQSSGSTGGSGCGMTGVANHRFQTFSRSLIANHP